MGAPGCDDAPYITVERDPLVKKKVQFIYPFYRNPAFLEHQLGVWRSYPDELKSCLTVTVVDDGSPEEDGALQVLKRTDRKGLPPLRLFRIDVDVRWNWLAARNIGAHHAKDGWLLITDMDHVVPQDTLSMLVYGKHSPKNIYRFSRVEHSAPEVKIHNHPNSWFYTKEMYWRIGGHDEAFSGFYGTDGEYRRRCAATAPIFIHREPLVRYEYQGDSSTTHYKRKQPEDAAVKQIIGRRKRGWQPRVLSFPYREISINA